MDEAIFKVDVYNIFIHPDYPEGVRQLIQDAYKIRREALEFYGNEKDGGGRDS